MSAEFGEDGFVVVEACSEVDASEKGIVCSNGYYKLCVLRDEDVTLEVSFEEVVASSVDGEKVFICMVTGVAFHGGVDSEEFVWSGGRHHSGGCDEVNVGEVGSTDCFSAVCPCCVFEWWNLGVWVYVEYPDAVFGGIYA